MKKSFWKWISAVTVCVVAVVVFLIGFFYMRDVSDKIYVDSTDQLRETYKIVGRSVKTYINQKWRLLNDWKKNVADPDFDFASRKEEWFYHDFYFIASPADRGEPDGGLIAYMTPEGRTGTVEYSDSWQTLFEGGDENMLGIVADGRAHDENGVAGQMITLFAVGTDAGTFTPPDKDPFAFSAIAISFTNDAIVRAIDTSPYGGEANCYVIHSDGRTLFSMEAGGDNLTNYLVYLRGKDAAAADKLAQQFEDGVEENLVSLDINGQEHCIYFQRLGYQDYYLLSIVPRSVISRGFLEVQRNTTIVFIVIFSIIGVAVVALLLARIYMQSRKSTAELRYREQMFDILSNSVDDIFIMIDPDTQKIDYLSPNIEPLLGIPYEEARSNIRSVAKCAVDYNIIVPKEELAEIPENGNRFWECEYMHQSTGERRWYRVTIYHMRVADAKKYIIVMSDRTAERQMNQNLQEALDAAKSANEAKSNFLSNMSHDIRTPMNAIVGFSVLLEKDANDPEKVREYTRKITASGQHLLSIINDVLDMSKIENGKTSLNVEPFSLPMLLEELTIIAMPQAKAKMQEFSVSVNGNPPEQIVGDKLRLNRILLNILSNAVKYTPENGKIDFVVSALPSSAPQLAKLRFVVRDNGIGMSEEYLKTIFDPFSREINSVTNKVQGTGLGMAITKSLVDLMGGIIAVESAPGKGSTFTVELSFPLADGIEADKWFDNVRSMLVADDEKDICDNVREVMRDTGVAVECVYSGADAVEAVRRAQADGKDFDVILLDWKMPEMDGVETARKIRELTHREIPILVLTSYDWADIETEARKAGINAFMSKPFFLSTFRQTIRHLFDKQTVTAETRDDVLQGRHFLIVEDNELNAEILTEMLSMEGATSELATNGAEALERFFAADPEQFDMILMDVQMPVMNGYEATRRIRASDHPRARTIPIVAMTANAFAEDVRDALDAGMDGHLAKPIDMAKVKALIGKLLKHNDPEENQT